MKITFLCKKCKEEFSEWLLNNVCNDCLIANKEIESKQEEQ